MRTSNCSCGNRLFFENSQCLNCGSAVAWCERCGAITSLTATQEGRHQCDGCKSQVQLCQNYETHHVCNRCFPAEGKANARLCCACELTEIIPDLSVSGNLEKWAKLEAAKRRLLYQLNQLCLVYHETSPPLRFDFKGDLMPANSIWRKGAPHQRVLTGHSDGRITINIMEADDVSREKMRVDMNEPRRSLIGHFRHEIGHFYWQLLVAEKQEASCAEVFGDPYATSYDVALQNHYESGPVQDWAQNYISAYASSHPWEDFAETFALYLDMISVLDTAAEFGLTSRQFTLDMSLRDLVINYQQIGIAVNELNRCLGVFDLVPEVIAPPVVDKLEYIHNLVHAADAEFATQPAV